MVDPCSFARVRTVGALRSTISIGDSHERDLSVEFDDSTLAGSRSRPRLGNLVPRRPPAIHLGHLDGRLELDRRSLAVRPRAEPAAPDLPPAT